MEQKVKTLEELKAELQDTDKRFDALKSALGFSDKDVVGMDLEKLKSDLNEVIAKLQTEMKENNQ